MTRGKYAARAAGRRAAEDTERTTEAHLRQIRDLTAERARYEATLTAERKEHAKELRILRAQRDEALGPEIAARDHVIAELRAEVEQLAAHKQARQRKVARLLHTLKAEYARQGMSPSAAEERAMAVAYEGELDDVAGRVRTPIASPNNALRKMTREQVLTLKRTRGDDKRYGKLYPAEEDAQ